MIRGYDAEIARREASGVGIRAILHGVTCAALEDHEQDVMNELGGPDLVHDMRLFAQHYQPEAQRAAEEDRDAASSEKVVLEYDEESPEDHEKKGDGYGKKKS